MRWPIERYVKLYRRDTAEWALVPWRARGLFYELLRKCDLDGSLECGKLTPARAVRILVSGGPEDEPEIERLLAALLVDGCVRDVPSAGSRGRHLFFPNYLPAQEAIPLFRERSGGAERTAKWRAKLKAKTTQSVTSVTRDGVTPHPIPSYPSHPIHPSQPASLSANGRHRAVEAAAGRQAVGQVEIEVFRRELSARLGRPLGGCRGQSAGRLAEQLQRLGLEAAVKAGVEVAEELERRRDPLRSVAALPGWFATVTVPT